MLDMLYVGQYQLIQELQGGLELQEVQKPDESMEKLSEL